MVTLDQIRTSNARIVDCLPTGMVAVFAGGTSGIGEATMKEFTKRTSQPRIYFIGRSEQAARHIKNELRSLNPAGEYHFIKADLSLLQDVDRVCREVRSQESRINLLFLTSGTLITGRETREKIYYFTALTYYGRIRLVVNLLPLLRKAPALRRVVSVFGGTKEGPINPEDMQGRNLPIHKLRAHTSSLMTLALESLALEAPDVSFVHAFPGSVRGTKIGRDVSSTAITVKRAITKVVGVLGTLSLSEAGERHLFLATSARFPPRWIADVETTTGVTLDDGIEIAKGSDRGQGSGVYSVDFHGEPSSHKVEEIVKAMRDDDLVRDVWLHTVSEFSRVTGSEFV